MAGKSVFPVLQLMRPANVLTALSDVWAGIAISGGISWAAAQIGLPALLLSLSTMALYAGGIVMNDVYDYALDKIERPERVLPSGQIALPQARGLGYGLLLLGIILAFMASLSSGIIALLITACALIYNRWGKHHPLLGPPNMGLCRGLNLLLGLSIIPGMLAPWYGLALAPILYIAAITLISRGEVHGSGSGPLYAAVTLYTAVVFLILGYAIYQQHLWLAALFLLLFCGMIFPPLIRALRAPTGPAIGKAVKAGVLALILMNASWAAASGSPFIALFISILLPVSLWFSRRFAVT